MLQRPISIENAKLLGDYYICLVSLLLVVSIFSTLLPFALDPNGRTNGAQRSSNANACKIRAQSHRTPSTFMAEEGGACEHRRPLNRWKL